MEPLGVRLLFAPGATATALAFVVAGVLVGTFSGLTPGVHVNTVTLLLASVAPSLPGEPRYVGAAILAAGVVHTFLDVIPALALGVPDAAMAATALPGHSLVLGGRGREALRLSAFGSGLAALLALPLAVPITGIMTAAYPTVLAHLPLILGAVVLLLIATEPTRRGMAGGLLAVLLSGLLGWVVLGLTPTAPLGSGNVLMPVFSGLFGAPVLLDALRGGTVPPQRGSRIAAEPRAAFGTALAGTVAGAFVAYLPGVSSAIAAVAAISVVPGRVGSRGFIVATSGVNTANTIFALFALASLGTARTGVMVALEEARAPVDLPLLLGAALLAASAGFLLVLRIGDRYLDLVGRLDYARLSAGVLLVLAVGSYLLAGPLGVGILAASAAVGLVPVRLGVRRVHLMGVLLLPLILR